MRWWSCLCVCNVYLFVNYFDLVCRHIFLSIDFPNVSYCNISFSLRFNYSFLSVIFFYSIFVALIHYFLVCYICFFVSVSLVRRSRCSFLLDFLFQLYRDKQMYTSSFAVINSTVQAMTTNSTRKLDSQPNKCHIRIAAATMATATVVRGV